VYSSNLLGATVVPAIAAIAPTETAVSIAAVAATTAVMAVAAVAALAAVLVSGLCTLQSKWPFKP
jgi:hypothetical protein